MLGTPGTSLAMHIGMRPNVLDRIPSALKKRDMSIRGTLKEGLKERRHAMVPGWWDRRYLPHVESQHLIQHVCFPLADSLPRVVVEQMAAELEALPPEMRDQEKEQRVHAYLDAGRGSCVLQNDAVADLVTGALQHF